MIESKDKAKRTPDMRRRFFAAAILLVGCGSVNEAPPEEVSCDYDMLEASMSVDYAFDGELDSYFTPTLKWPSENAALTQVQDRLELTAESDDVSNALEAWLPHAEQMPYNKSWTFGADVTVPLAWDSAPGRRAQVGIGMFVARPEASGPSPKVYECNLATVAKKQRFVQAQLIANRLGEDPINVRARELTDEAVYMELRWCAEEKKIQLLVDGVLLDTQSLDSKGLDDWKLRDADFMDVGVMGFAEHVEIKEDSPSIDNVRVRIF